METTMQNASEIQKLEEKLEEKIEQQNEERKIEEVWKETVELKSKLLTIEQSQTRLLQTLEQMTMQLTKIETLLDQAIEEVEESDSDSESETVKVEIVTQSSQEQQEQSQMNQQTQKSLLKKILLG